MYSVADWYEDVKLMLEFITGDVEHIQEELDTGNIGMVRRRVRLLREVLAIYANMSPPPTLGCGVQV